MDLGAHVDDHGLIPTIPESYFQSYFLSFIYGKNPNGGGGNARKHRLWPVKSFIHHKQNGQGSITFSISLQDIWCNGIGLKWHRLMVGRRERNVHFK